MTVASRTVNDQLVYHDATNSWRWLDALGPDVFKLELKAPVALQAADSLAAFKTTLAGGSTIADAPDIAGGAILITTAGADNNGVNLHTISEPLTFQYRYPAYFGIRLQTNDADQSVLWAGMGMADDDWHGSVPNDYCAFYKADEGTDVAFAVSKDGAATSLAGVATLADNQAVTLEMYFDGTTFYAYADGVLKGSIAYTNANVPSDGEELAPTIEFLTGEGNAATCTIQWARWIQVQREGAN